MIDIHETLYQRETSLETIVCITYEQAYHCHKRFEGPTHNGDDGVSLATSENNIHGDQQPGKFLVQRATAPSRNRKPRISKIRWQEF